MDESLIVKPREVSKEEIVQSSGVKEEVGQVKETTGDSSGPPPSLLVESKQRPEICNLLEMGEAYGQFDVGDKSREIDKFILAEMDRYGMDDTKDSYKKVLDNLYKHLTPSDNIYSTVDNLLEWVRIQQKLIDVAKAKKEFLEKSPEDMSVKELEKLLRGEL